MYLYEGHMGGLYTNEDYLDFEELYCESCGDSDFCFGSFETEEELRNVLLEYYEYDKVYEYDEYYTKEEHEEYKKDILARIEEYVKVFIG